MDQLPPELPKQHVGRCLGTARDPFTSRLTRNARVRSHCPNEVDNCGAQARVSLCPFSRFAESSALLSPRDGHCDVATFHDRQNTLGRQFGRGTIMSDPASARAVTEVRPFRIEVSQQEIDELRRRIAATRWPTRELVDDRSQGVQLATMQELARYWTTEYDWRRCEARLNALPQFK